MANRMGMMYSSSHEDPIHRAHYAHKQHHHHGPLSVVELRVPMCCPKCREKVQEELEDLDGVRTVECDQFHQRVTVAGYVDPLRVLKKAKKVKKKSEFYTQGGHAHGSHRGGGPYAGQNSVHRDSVRHAVQPSMHRGSARYDSGHRDSVRYADQVSVHRDSVHYASEALGHGGSGQYAGQHMMHDGPVLTRTNSFERGLSRQSFFTKMGHYNDHGLRHPGFDTQDLQRDYYGGRRMPSFKKHRYHDAEYVSMGDDFMPQYGEAHYAWSQHPALQSQVSFSRTVNPNYVKPAYLEY